MKGKVKKLVRDKVKEKLHTSEYEYCENKEELNNLVCQKIREELLEVINSDFSDIKEFADLTQIVQHLCKINGFSSSQINKAIIEKTKERGGFSNLVLTNLNPNNSSNNIYFEEYYKSDKNESLEKSLKLVRDTIKHNQNRNR